MGTQYWMATTREGLHKQVTAVVQVIGDTEFQTRTGLLPTTINGKWIVDVFFPTLAIYLREYNRRESSQGRLPDIVQAFNDAQKEFKKVFRYLYTYMLKNNMSVTNEDLVRMTLPPRNDGSHEPSPIAPFPPLVIVDRTEHSRLTLRIYAGTLGQKYIRRKPPGQHGAEVKWVLLKDANPLITELDLVNSTFFTNHKARFIFNSSQKGYRFYFMIRWENKVGQKGSFSHMYEESVP